MLTSPVGRFRLLALAEAVSWAGLLIGMFFKYVVVENEIGVKVFGPIHGMIFVGYVLVTLMVRDPQRWDLRTTFIALLASIPPFGTIIFERWANRTGKLDPQAMQA
jgi:integral membrane protein